MLESFQLHEVGEFIKTAWPVVFNVLVLACLFAIVYRLREIEVALADELSELRRKIENIRLEPRAR